MKKKVILVALAVAAMTLMAGCSSKTVTISDTDGSFIPADCATLGEYKGLTVEAEKTAVTEEDIDAEIQSLLDSASYTQEVTDRAAKLGDTVNIDYVGTMDGVAFENGSTDPANGGEELVLGSAGYIDGFEDGIVGGTTGTTFDIAVTFPDEYPNNPDFEGKDATFAITLNGIYETITPELTDDIVPTLVADCTTIAELREYVSNQLLEAADEAYKFAVSDAALTQIMESSTFAETIPENLTDFYYNATIEQEEYYLNYYASAYGIEVEELVTALYGVTLDEYYAQLKVQAENTAKLDIIIRLIAAKERIKISKSEIKDYAQESADSYGIESAEEYISQVGEYNVEMALLYRAVVDRLNEDEFTTVVAPGTLETEETTDDAAVTDDTAISEGESAEGTDTTTEE